MIIARDVKVVVAAAVVTVCKRCRLLAALPAILGVMLVFRMALARPSKPQ